MSAQIIIFDRLPAGFIAESPDPELKMIVIIPAFAEPDLSPTLESLARAADEYQSHIEVIIVINQSINVEQIHAQSNQKLYEHLSDLELDLSLHIIWVKEIPHKIAGVGMARKIAMDEAALRLSSTTSGDKGLIISLDADTTVETSYFQAIDRFYDNKPRIELANLSFQHRVDLGITPTQPIVLYELYLRYFIGMQRWLQLPYAYQTIGSAFAVTVQGYRSVGGMNRRKAGEDFYFIHKFTKKGTIADCPGCKVYPSDRPSFRVPFGTGKAVSQITDSEGVYETYHPQSFIELAGLITHIDRIYDSKSTDILHSLSPAISSFLELYSFDEVMTKLLSNTTSLKTFRKAFYQWFDAFRLMKYLHHSRDHYHHNIDIVQAVTISHRMLDIQSSQSNKPEDLLSQLRSIADQNPM